MPTIHRRHLDQLQPTFPGRVHYGLIASALTVAAAYGSLVPFGYSPIDFSDALQRFFNAGFLEMDPYWREDLAVNVMLFVPIGYLWLGAIDADRRGRVATWIAAPIMLVLLGCVSVLIEFSQMWFPRRSPSLGDVGAQVIGSGIGMLGWLVVGRRATDWLRQFFSRGGGVVDWRLRLLQLYATGFIFYQFLPMDLVFSPEEIRWKIDAGRVLLIPLTNQFRDVFEMLWQWGVDTLLFIPIGALMRVGWMPAGRFRSVPTALGMALLLATTIEGAQLFILSRFVDTTDVLTSGLGGLIGAVGVVKVWQQLENGEAKTGEGVRPEHKLKIAAAMCGIYAVPVMASYWYPFDWVFDLNRLRAQIPLFFDYPFKHFYWGSEFVAATNVMRAVMLFTPIGAFLRWGLIAHRDRISYGWVLCLIVATGLGLIIEMGQAMTASKTADMTDMVLYITGAMLGWGLAGRWLEQGTTKPMS